MLQPSPLAIELHMPPAPSAPAPLPSTVRRDAAEAFLALCDLLTHLRSPQGCEWDQAQDLQTLRPYLLEEAYEVLAVLDKLPGDGGGPLWQEHRDELGDLLMHVIFQAEIQREQDRFDIKDVCDAIRAKLERRHPHLFGPPGTPRMDWESLKRAERKNQPEARQSALAGVPPHLPALLRAYRVGEKAHRVGFDWPDVHGVLDKIDEEVAEVKEAIALGDKAHVAEEIGDLMYAIVNLTRHFGIDPEATLRQTIGKFERRFGEVETRIERDGKSPEQLPLAELERYWTEVKLDQRNSVEGDDD